MPATAAPSVYDSDDWRALLRKIQETPESDLFRLVAADWLEERGEEARAELIRVQCEYEGTLCHQPGTPAGSTHSHWCNDSLCHHCTLYRRANEILGRVDVALGKLFRRSNEYAWLPSDLAEWLDARQDRYDRPAVGWRRGFPDSIALKQAEYLGGPCDRCGATGCPYCGGDDADYHDECRLCPECDGQEAQLGIAGALSRLDPDLLLTLTEVTLTDQVAYPARRDANRVAWFHPDVPSRGHRTQRLTPELFAALDGYSTNVVGNSSRVKWYDSRKLADEALSRALVAIGGERAGLDPPRLFNWFIPTGRMTKGAAG